MKKHNGVISIWKFIFAIEILLHHLIYLRPEGNTLAHFGCASIGVDFFFMVSGWLLAKKAESEWKRGDGRPLYEATWSFLLGKIKGVFPYVLFSWLIFLGITLIVVKPGTMSVLMSTLDLTFLLAAIKPDYNILGGCWYLSAMMISMLLIYPLEKKYRKNFSLIIAPLFAVFFGGYMLQNCPSLRDWKASTGHMHVGLLKAIFEISLGTTAYELSEKLKDIRFKKAGKMLLSLAELGSLGFVLFMNLWYNDVRKYDALWILLIFFGVSVAFSGRTFFFEICCNRVFYYLEKLSTALYLNNFVFVRLCNRTETLGGLTLRMKMAVVVFGAIALSVLELPVIAGVKRLLCAAAPKVKGLFVEGAEEKNPA